MTTLLTKDMRLQAAKNFKEYIENSNNSVYLTIGKVSPWANDSAPATPICSTDTYTNVWDSMFGGKKITGNDMSLTIPRHTWASNTSYAEYRSDSDLIANNDIAFYVVTSNWNVYKCISNNYSSLSTVEPTSVSTTNISNTSDGYKWKFMYQLSTNDRQRFMTSNVIPVKTLTTDNGSLQWGVQNNATSGAIYHAYIQNGGSGYSNAANIIVTISGDGSGANATVGINNISNSVNSITFSSYGSGYTYATILLSGDTGSDANIISIIAPPGGHGYDPESELSGYKLIINPRIRNSENGILSTNNEIRQIAIISNPKIYNSSNVMSNNAFSQTRDLYVSTTGTEYIEDEFVYQGSISIPTFSGRVLQWDSANSLIKLINTYGTPTAEALYGANSSAARFVTITTEVPDCQPHTGKILYVENISPIARAYYQTENFKITLDF